MARRPKKLTRKDIRRPDQFITFTGTLFDFFSRNRTQFLIASSLLILTVSALWFWEFYNVRQNRLASRDYFRAINLYHEGKPREALALLKAVTAYRNSSHGPLATIQLANAHIALKEPTQAGTILREFLAAEHNEPLVRQSALLALGYAEELSGNCNGAIDHFTAAEKTPGPLKEEALLAAARCSIQAGDPKQALALYKRYLTDFPGSDRVSEIVLRVQMLEGQVTQ
ncbi:MAG: tetratricopeptide repeat protein, partial [Candidatus Binatia bacterium]